MASVSSLVENQDVARPSPTLLVRNVRLYGTPDDATVVSKSYNVTCVDGTVSSVVASENDDISENSPFNLDDIADEILDAKGSGLLLPGYVAYNSLPRR